MVDNTSCGGGRIRIGAVSYLNTKPLVCDLERFAPEADLVFDLPSRLADDLSRGELDVALIPSIEFFQDPSYTIVSDACIGCRGPVLSVKLLSRVPMREITTLALDEGSRTSVALARILLLERFGLTPRLENFAIGDEVTQCQADAMLVIGDRAIHPPEDEFVEQWDLGEEWCRWAELPFVFAMWVARAGTDLRDVDHALSLARDEGLKNMERIARAEAAPLGLSNDECLSYLRDNLYFYLGARERRGLELFYRHAASVGLAPEGLDLCFDDCQAS